MIGRVAAVALLACALVAGAAMYWLQTRAFYERIPDGPGAEVRLTSLSTGAPEPITYDGFEAIDATSSPIRYRACFTTPLRFGTLTETYAPAADPVPLTAPGWFDCFDAAAIAEALDSGDALAFMGHENITYGIDRIVAITRDGRGYSWHRINACGEVVFDGRPPPEGCPPPPS
jgi:hypothetical protein